MTNIEINGQELKVIVMNDNRTREKIVSQVQDLLFQKKVNAGFSLAGLEKLFKGELPKRRALQIIEALAEVLMVKLSDFAESEAVAS